jgi:hypothetical protein
MIQRKIVALMRERDIMSIAYLFEGEGCILTPKNRSVQVKVVMTDLDTLERLNVVFPAPNGIVPIKKSADPTKAHYKQDWRWQLSSKVSVETFLRAVKPYFSARRRAKCIEALHILARTKSRDGTCKKGHKLSEYQARRRCKICDQEKKASYYQRDKARREAATQAESPNAHDQANSG